MPIDPQKAIGAELPPLPVSWGFSDVLLYHLALGAGSNPGDQLDAKALRYTLENDLQVLPTFAVIAPTLHETDAPSLDLPGCDINLAQVVHGAQEVHLAGPLPTDASGLTLTRRISDVWDKGKAAVIWQEHEARDTDGNLVYSTRSSIFVKGEGGFGGSRGDAEPVVLPHREPDAVTSYTTTPQQALLYRLCGDRNPLHADPAFAEMAGFPAPILHGLCTYGITARLVVDALLDGDVARVGGFAARFAGVVYPGETIKVAAWDEGDRIVVSATVGDDDRPALADCVLTVR
ncbi:MAG TPA: MaoC/PaaZ C-terminal domain-containing protein [Nocardioidaceae bacterium]|nr:MaoC/PaaZ C-terminal domain-containing protein [Nocardioidaceae bacterium]